MNISGGSMVTVIDADAIDATSLRDVRRIDDLVPNVAFNEKSQLGGIFVPIRGVESNPFIINRAAVHIDGIPFRELSNAVLNQVESIEVLRGPQATLYRTTLQTEGTLDLGFGSVGLHRLGCVDQESRLRASGNFYGPLDAPRIVGIELESKF